MGSPRSSWALVVAASACTLALCTVLPLVVPGAHAEALKIIHSNQPLARDEPAPEDGTDVALSTRELQQTSCIIKSAQAQALVNLNIGWGRPFGSWDPSLSCGAFNSWRSVFCACSSSGADVTRLDVSSRGIRGTMAPDAFAALGQLVILTMKLNQLNGTIPSSLGTISGLVSLSLSTNQFTGSIPASLGNLDALTYLSLSNNQLTGGVPAVLGNVLSLNYLNLNGNQLSGTIPAALGSLTNLRGLTLERNLIGGTIPAALGNLGTLSLLSLYTLQLSGSIPAALGNLLTLTYLSLSDNQLTGTIPSALGLLTGLRTLSLSDNQLGGTIPAALGSLRRLYFLDLSSNKLTGFLDPYLRNLDQFFPLVSLADNLLYGMIWNPNDKACRWDLSNNCFASTFGCTRSMPSAFGSAKCADV